MARRNSLVESVSSNFGRITVFKPLIPNKDSDAGENEKPKHKEKILNDTIIIENNKQTGSYLTNSTDDFYGIEEDEKILTNNKNEFKKQQQTGSEFIDEAFNLNIENQDKQSITKTTTTIITKSDLENLNDLNYFDQIMLQKNSKAVENSNKNITTNEIKNDKDLNYIDETYFKNDSDQSNIKTTKTIKNLEKSVGSIRNFKAPKIAIKKEKPTEKIEFDDKIDLDKNEEKIKASVSSLKTKTATTSEVSEKNKHSKHKQLQSEIPNWYKMTIDDAARLLLKHVCYFNVEHGVLALDKPYGLPSIGGPGVHLSVSKLMPRLKELLKIDYDLYMMHRLDETTTGVMLFATNKESEFKIRNLFNERKIIKQYLAITKYVPKDKEGEINIPLIEREANGLHKVFLSPNYSEETSLLLDKPKNNNPNRKNAITRYRVLDSFERAALIECQPLTGLKHQIRVHLSFGLGCPILGDHKYSHHLKLAPQKLPTEMLKSLKITQSKVRYVPMHLHSYRIILPEYFNNQNIFITAKLPLHFRNNLNRLKLLFK